MKIFYRYPKYPIFAMADTKSNIAAKLEGTTLQIVKHIIKIYLYPEHPAVNHWKTEVYGFLHTIPRIKRKNTFPTKEFILQETIGVNRSVIPLWVENVVDDYGESDRDESNVMAAIEDYYSMLAEELSYRGDISKQKVYAKLTEIQNLR